MGYKTGIYVGRFQPIHKGHLKCIKLALRRVDRLVIVIGSANKCRTLDNPLTYEERLELIINSLIEYDINLDRVVIVGLEDFNNNDLWASHLMYKLKGLGIDMGSLLYISGGIDHKTDIWFKSYKLNYLSVDRSDDNISATDIREAITDNNMVKLKDELTLYVYNSISILRDILLGIVR